MSSPPAPQHCPSPRELDDLELLLSGALAPLTDFDEPDSVVTLSLPPELADAPEIELVDPEGLPLARATRDERGALEVESLTHPQYGPFRRLHLSPAQVRGQYAGRTFVPVAGAITDQQLDQLSSLGPVVLLALVGASTPDLSPVALLRATLRAAELLPAAAVVVAIPLASHGDAEADHQLGVQVVANYAGPDLVVGLAEGGAPIEAVHDILDADQPPPDGQGLVLFFTGLSGSGKSTLAQALMDRVLEQGRRTLTSLDGDVVRRNLSAGLTFSKVDRETNIRRIGWVAAEISRHGGVAVCSPIAPFDETRQQVRAMVKGAGGAFFLVHVATPLEECERRDRKGLYAKARRGEIPEFTGISSPYEEPEDADVRVDTTGRTINDALSDVVDALAAAGYLDLREVPYVEPTAYVEPPDVELVETQPPYVEPPDVEPVETPPTPYVEPVETPPPYVEPVETRRPLKVLFVCTANICRSPAMEAIARSMVDDRSVTFASAGTHGFRDSEMDPTMAEAVRATGVDPSGFRSRALTRDLVDDADLVITAEAAHRSFILDDDPAAFRQVFTLGQLAEGVARLDSGLDRDEALAAFQERRTTADPTLDVSDPYRRGPEAAQQCVDKIYSLLSVIVPALT